MSEKLNPWLDEGARYDDQEKKKKRDIRDMKFLENNEHKIRILPAKNANDSPMHGYKQHWIPQNGTNISKPITHGLDDRCSVCDYISVQWDEIHRLKEEEDMTDKSPEVEALFAKQGKVSAKSRYDMNIIDRKDSFAINEETGEKKLVSKRMCAVPTVYKEIFSFAKKWGSPSNEKSGYDLEINTSGTKERREYSVIPDRNSSPLSEEETKLLDSLYDLKALRKSTPVTEIRKILENAKAPYDEIINFMKPGEGVEGEATTSTKPTDSAKEVAKEIEKEIKKTEPVAVKQEAKPVAEVAKQEQLKASAPVAPPAPEPTDDEKNIEVYECKGDFDENDKMCSDCPVKASCEQVHPFYVKAKQQGINVDPRRSTQDVVADVKKTETPEPAVAKSTRGKKIPF